MSALLDVEAKFKDFADKITAGLDDLRQNAVPIVHDASESLERLTQTKVVNEILQFGGTIDPALDEALAAIVRGAGAAAAKVAELTAPPAPAEGEPAPGDPQIQTGIAT